MNDHELLREYVAAGSQSAFTQLVERHLPLVWSAARRHVEDADFVKDVSQQVFTLLGRKASRLAPNVILSGWLYRTTCHIASRLARSERRRIVREREAMAMANDNDATSIWRQLEPLLDGAMGTLGELDRDAIVLRYFEKKSLKEVGAALGTNDDAVQKRLRRALDKLRDCLARRGLSVTTGSLIAAIGAGSIQPAPAALAITMASVAVLSSTTTTFSLVTATMIKSALTAAAIVTLAATSVVQYKSNRSLRTELDAAHVSLPHEPGEREQATRAPVSFRNAPEFSELLRLRGEVARLRPLESELAKLKAELAGVRQALSNSQTAATPSAPAIPPASAPAVDEVKIKHRSNLKQIGMGLRMLANEDKDEPYLVNGRLSPQLISLLGGTENAAMKMFQNVTLLVSDAGVMQKLEREAPMQVVAHSINAFPTTNGSWSRLYLHADGHVEERQHAQESEIWDGTKR